MTGESNLKKLIKNLRPRLHEGKYVFCSVSDTSAIDSQRVLLEFKEAEGITLILTEEEACRLGLSYDFVAAWITLDVHSSLEAVGLTATFSTALAKAGISCNVVAGYHHDHLFLPHEDRLKAMEILEALSLEPKR